MSNPTWEETEEVSTTPSKSSTVPTWDDTTGDDELLATPDVNAIEANRRAMLQGASLGFSDELTAGAKALGETAFGDKKFADLLDTYRSQVKQERDKLKEGKEQYPTSTTVAEIGGSILPSFAIGGIGAVSSIGKVPAMTSAMKLGASGLMQGGAAGLGESEADLTDPTVENLMEAGKDTGIGAGVGFGAGIALPALAKGAGALARGAKDTAIDMAPNFVKRGVDAFNVAERGIPVIGTKANERLQSDALKTAEDLLSEFRGQYKRGSEKVGSALTSGDTKVDFSGKLKELEDTLKNSSMLPDDLAKIQKELANYKDIITKETVEPGIDKAITRMEKLIEKEQSKADILGSQLGVTRQEPTDNFLNTLLSETSASGEPTARVLQTAIPEDKVIQETIESYKNMSLSDLNNVKKELSEILRKPSIDSKSKGIISGLIKEVDDNIVQNMTPEAQALFREGNQELSNVYKAGDIYPELGDRFGNDLDIPLAKKLLGAENLKGESLDRAMSYGTEIPDALQQSTRDLNARQGLSKALQGEGSVLGGFVNPSSMAVRVGAALGNITNKAEAVVKPVKDFTKNIIRMEDSAITGLANKLRSSGNQNASDFADKLDKIIQSPKRDRLLWSLSQQPAFRELVNKDEPQN